MTPSFRRFLESEAGKKATDAEFADRLIRSDARIDTVTALLRFSRERWPREFHPDYRKDKPGERHGREEMRLLWQQYLAWAEATPERKPVSGPKAVVALKT